MLAVISPARKLNFETEAPPGKHSQPEFLDPKCWWKWRAGSAARTWPGR
jgi:cytoplasmic iron level regulating protein YaaA (DUF328/UPF0246 family)